MPSGVIINHPVTFQNTNTPDIDLDRDLIVGGGMVTEENGTKTFQFNFSTIIMSALIFLAILAWFDFMQTTFYTWLQPETQENDVSPANKLWYSLLITVVVFCLCALIIIHADKFRI